MSKGIDQPRWAKWVRVSNAIRPLVEPNMVHFIHGLGKLDAELVDRERAFLARSTEEHNKAPEWELNDMVVQAALWVLGAYEVSRTMSERMGSHPTFIDDVLRKRVRAVKIDFERVRIPLAKFETALAWPNDSGIAFPAIDRDKSGVEDRGRDIRFSARPLG